MKLTPVSVFIVTILIHIVHCIEYDRSSTFADSDSTELKTDDDLTYAESVRNVRLIDNSQAWRGAQRIQVEDDQPLEPRPQKRRRLRKRKRRPQPYTDDQGEIQIVRPRRRRPIRLDEIDDGWKEMEAEGPQRPYTNRRRTGPIYQEETTVKLEDESSPTTSTTEPTTSLKDIKDILKQADGLSLSEILLQKNLTLSDLLRGNQNAISALSERPQQDQTVTEKHTFDHNAPPEEVIREIPPPHIQEQNELRRKDEQRKRLSQLYSQENQPIYSDLTTKYEVVTEATTEKRIFVPSHPKYYTSVNFKPEFELATEAPKRTTLKLPVTSAQLNGKIKRPEVKETEKPQPISLGELFGYNPESGTKEDGPLKMSFALEDLKQNIIQSDTIEKVNEADKDPKFLELTTEDPSTTLQPTVKSTESELEKDSPVSERLTTTQRFSKKVITTIKPTATTTTLPQKVTVSAKEEILEIMRNTEVKEELEVLLTSRNMTLEQLVEQRERGSSQRHLAEIFHNNTKEPEPTQVVEFVKTIQGVPEVYNQRRPKLISTPSTTTTTTSTTQIPETTSHKQKPLEDVNMSSEEITVSERLPSTSFPTYKIETNKMSKEIPPLHIPIWKTIYPSIYIESEHQDKKAELNAIEHSIQEAVDDGLNELSRNNNLDEYDDYIHLPIGVKSAIFASLAIIGMSLVVFLTILVIFRWSQKHKKRLCYGNNSGSSFSCSKIKSPILQHGPKRTIRTFVSETLGKRRNFYAQHFRQSMSDSWESNERPYQ